MEDRQIRLSFSGRDALWLLFVGVLSSAWSLSAGREIGATFDEPTHLLEGVKSWRSGSNKQLMTWGAMPLPIDVQTLPIYLWERYRGEPFDTIAQQDELLPVMRATTMLFWWLLLTMLYRWAKLLGGNWAARIATAGVATDPNLLGHASLGTTDIALVSMVLLSTFYFYIGRESGWLWRVVVPGLLYGLALSTKASALPYVPLLCLIFGMHRLIEMGQINSWKPVALWYSTIRLRWDLFYMMLIGAVVVVGYCGCDWTTEPTFIDWIDKQPEGFWKETLTPISRNLKIFPNAGEGLIQQIKHNMRGHHGSFIAGVWHPKSVWYYFPVALSIKLPESTLILLVLTLLLGGRSFLSNPAGAAALVLLIFSLSTKVQIGVRLVFPCVMFAWIAMGSVCIGLSGWRRLVLQCAAMLAILNSAYASFSVWPDGLLYANKIWGGPERVDDWLTDSNCDWGQGLPQLKTWWEQNEKPTLHVWYYGIDKNILMHPMQVYPINTLDKPSMQAVKDHVGEGCLAVSASLLNACPDRRPETLEFIASLKNLKPVGRTSTFRIYRFRSEPSARK
jgi:hypothetical protein